MLLFKKVTGNGLDAGCGTLNTGKNPVFLVGRLLLRRGLIAKGPMGQLHHQKYEKNSFHYSVPNLDKREKCLRD